MKLKYTHVDQQGMRWRMVGGRPVSEIADQLNREMGLPVAKEHNPTKPKPKRKDRQWNQ